METLKGLRKELKKIGFGVRTKSLSFGRSATYYHIETKKELRGNVYTADSVLFWKVLTDFRESHKIELQHIRQIEDVTGLV